MISSIEITAVCIWVHVRMVWDGLLLCIGLLGMHITEWHYDHCSSR
jgi:hypothetical protein